MNEPSIRNVALLPVLAVVAGGVLALSTVVDQGAPATEDCGPGSHAMSMGESKMAGMDHSMPGMDHGAMGMSGGCMQGDSMPMEQTPGAESDEAPVSKQSQKPTAKHGKSTGSPKSGPADMPMDMEMGKHAGH